jgi:cellulose synthase/poly-beta-1,6-N-acetylglucosamine synthase-like glycosyltransferase
MEALFWLSAVLIAYVYVGYPVLLGTWAAVAGRTTDRGRSRKRATTGRDGAGLPGVSVVIAARNEAPRLPARVENLLASDYPMDRMQIIIASDGSTDGSAEAMAAYRSRVELLLLPPSGKAAALNAAVAHARNPILVFADARQRFAPDAVRRLVARFDDPRIGAVSGELVLDCEDGRADAAVARAASGSDADGRDRSGGGEASTIGDGVGAYWKYEKWLRRREAIVGSTLGVTGAIYAMRRWLWQPLPPDTILDDVLGPMRLVLRGYRVAFEGQAKAFDATARDASAELRRKVRTLAGNFQLLVQEPRLLLPGVNPVWVQFMSHKVGRLIVPYALVALYVASGALALESWFYAAAFAAQSVFYGLALYGAVLDRRGQRARAAQCEVIGDAA